MPKPEAAEAYKNGTITTINWFDPGYYIYEGHLTYPHGIAREISEINANDNDF